MLQQRASGQTVTQAGRGQGLREATLHVHAWQSKYAGASVAELTRLKRLEENGKRQPEQVVLWK